MPRKAKRQRLLNGFGRILGYYETYNDAYSALLEYNKNPYDLDSVGIRFNEVYKKWSAEYFKTLSSLSSIRTIESAYKYFAPISNMRFKDIHIAHMKGCIEDAKVGASTRSRMKSLFNLVFDYALEMELTKTNYVRNFEMKNLEKESNKKEKVSFSLEEISLLWDNVEKVQFVDMILVGIYSGWRPQELAKLKISDISLEDGSMSGGMKTSAGKNRIVPIHASIRELIENRYDTNNEFLFNDENGQQGTKMTYDKYRHRFDKVMKRLSLKHSPHETRHTFITLAKLYNVDEYALKRIVGHAIVDITENIYTHRDFSWLKDEISKIK